jgi:hypothetical protein
MAFFYSQVKGRSPTLFQVFIRNAIVNRAPVTDNDKRGADWLFVEGEYLVCEFIFTYLP